jgi:ribonuclease J
VVISSTPIPGNEVSYQQTGDDLASRGVTLFRHPTHELDGCGPLHVSGHAFRDEYAEMIRLTKPTYFMPIYGGPLNRNYHRQIGLEQNIAPENIIMADNGQMVEMNKKGELAIRSEVTTGALLVDQTGSVVPEIVTKDRLLLQGDGFVVVGITLSRATGKQLSSPDIITRGHVAVRDNAPMMDKLRNEMRTITARSSVSRSDVDQLRLRIKDTALNYLFMHTGQTPVVIPVVNLVGSDGRSNKVSRPVADVC